MDVLLQSTSSNLTDILPCCRKTTFGYQQIDPTELQRLQGATQNPLCEQLERRATLTLGKSSHSLAN